MNKDYDYNFTTCLSEILYLNPDVSNLTTRLFSRAAVS